MNITQAYNDLVDQISDLKIEKVILKDKYEAAHDALDWLGVPKEGYTVSARIELLSRLIPGLDDLIKKGIEEGRLNY